jgi:ribosomal protein L32
MSVRMKLTHSKTASRRAHHAAGTPRIVSTGAGARRRHFVDPDTGMYRGKQIITVGEEKPKAAKKAAKKKQSEDAPKADATADAK